MGLRIRGRIARSVGAIRARGYNEFRERTLRRTYSALADPDKFITVSLDKIQYILSDKTFIKTGLRGDVVEGYMDLEAFESFLERDNKISSVIQHFTQGVPWMQTELFAKDYTEKLKLQHVRGHRSLEQLEGYYKSSIEPLYESIKRRGLDYRQPDGSFRPMCVHVSEHGEIIWATDGNHRLGVCIVLGIHEFPCRVLTRHKAWQEKRERLMACVAAGDPIDPNLAAHPDMQDIVSGRNAARGRSAPAAARPTQHRENPALACLQDVRMKAGRA